MDIIKKPKIFIYHLSNAFIMSFIWVSSAKDYYNYKYDFLSIEGVNTYPIIAWTLGLVVMYIIYSLLEKYFKPHRFIMEFLLFSVIYWVLLILVESASYHIFLFRDIAVSNYPGLPICECIHGPRWMQLVYLSMGPIYFLLCKLLIHERPKQTITKAN